MGEFSSICTQNLTTKKQFVVALNLCPEWILKIKRQWFAFFAQDILSELFQSVDPILCANNLCTTAYVQCDVKKFINNVLKYRDYQLIDRLKKRFSNLHEFIAIQFW